MASYPREPNRRILAVDDEADVLEFLRIFLTSLSWEVHAVGSPEEAFEAIGQRAYFLVLSDIAMPRMDGYEFLSELQARQVPSEVAFMTGFGYDPNHTLVKIRKDARYPCLFKPFDRDKVALAVQRAFEMYHAAQPST